MSSQQEKQPHQSPNYAAEVTQPMQQCTIDDDSVGTLKFKNRNIRFKRLQSIALKEGSKQDLNETCDKWKQQNQEGQPDDNRSAEGVFIQSENKCRTVAIVDGHYDEQKDWMRSKVIGRGGSCDVFLCKDQQTGNKFCLKEYREKGVFDKAVNEVKNWVNLNHDCICNLLGAVRVPNSVDNEIKLIMDYIRGPTLYQLIKNQKKKKLKGCEQARLTLGAALLLLEDLLSVAEHHEQKGICHNDIKSDNILIEEKTGKVKMIDYNSSNRTVAQDTDVDDGEKDVVDILKVFFEMVTGVMLTGQSANLSEQDPPLIPDSLHLPLRVIDLFERAWQYSQERKPAKLLSDLRPINRAVRLLSSVIEFWFELRNILSQQLLRGKDPSQGAAADNDENQLMQYPVAVDYFFYFLKNQVTEIRYTIMQFLQSTTADAVYRYNQVLLLYRILHRFNGKIILEAIENNVFRRAQYMYVMPLLMILYHFLKNKLVL